MDRPQQKYFRVRLLDIPAQDGAIIVCMAALSVRAPSVPRDTPRLRGWAERIRTRERQIAALVAWPSAVAHRRAGQSTADENSRATSTSYQNDICEFESSLTRASQCSVSTGTHAQDSESRAVPGAFRAYSIMEEPGTNLSISGQKPIRHADQPP
jgi:hypothetical protein